MNDCLFNEPLSRAAMRKLEKKQGLPPRDERLLRLDPSSPFYQDGVDLFMENPGVSPEALQAMMAPIGFTIDLLPL